MQLLELASYREGKGILFATFSCMIWVTPYPGQVVAALDKTIYDNYLYSLFKQAANSLRRIRRNSQEHWIIGNYTQLRIPQITK